MRYRSDKLVVGSFSLQEIEIERIVFGFSQLDIAF
jgi:hypothetical protein